MHLSGLTLIFIIYVILKLICMSSSKKQLKLKIKPPKNEFAEQSNTMVIGLTILTILVSLAFSKTTNEPVIPIRYLILSIFCLGFILIFFWFKKYEIPTKFTILINAIFVLGILYTLWNAISLRFSINPYTGIYELLRYLMFLILIFFTMEIVRKEASSLIIVCKTIALVSILHSFIGIFQFYGLAFLELPGANEQPFGLMANRNLYGSAQSLALPFIFYTWFVGNSIWKKISLVTMSFLIVSILLSQTRSAWIASIIIVLSSVILISVYLKDYRKLLLKWVAIAGVSAIGLIFLTLLIANASGVETTITERFKSLATVTTSSETTDKNISSRKIIWQKTYSLIKDHPIWGTGLNNWKLVIPLYGAEGTGWETGNYLPDRAHNVYLQVMAESGVPGFLFYFGIWIITLIAGISVLRKNINNHDKIGIIIMIAGILGFMSDSVFSFPNERIEHSLFLTIMIGSILGFYQKANKITLRDFKPLPILLKACFLLIASANVIMGYKKYNFETAYYKSKGLENAGQYNEELIEVEKGKSTWITLDNEGKTLEMRSGLAFKALRMFPQAIKELEQSLIYNPNYPATWVNIGTVYTEMKNYKTAIEYYEKAVNYAPEFQIAKLNLAVNYYEVGKYKEAVQILEKIDFKKYPDLVDLLSSAKTKLQFSSRKL